MHGGGAWLPLLASSSVRACSSAAPAISSVPLHSSVVCNSLTRMRVRRNGLKIDAADRDIQPVAAWRLENTVVWKNYSAAVETVANQISRGLPIDSPKLPVLNREAINRALGPRDCGGNALERYSCGFRDDKEDAVRKDVNEAFLLHGADKRTVADILFGDSGLDPIFSVGKMVRGGKVVASRGLFGEGTYFAEDIEKADQYAGAEPDMQFQEPGLEALHKELYPSAADHPAASGGGAGAASDAGVCYVLVCRVIRGYAIRTNGTAQGNADQCHAMDGYEASDTGHVFHNESGKELTHMPKRTHDADGSMATKIRYHSLVAELGSRIVRFREFVIFHREYIYPEYVVAYRRCSRRGAAPSSAWVSDSVRPPDGLEPEPEPM